MHYESHHFDALVRSREKVRTLVSRHDRLTGDDAIDKGIVRHALDAIRASAAGDGDGYLNGVRAMQGLIRKTSLGTEDRDMLWSQALHVFEHASWYRDARNRFLAYADGRGSSPSDADIEAYQPKFIPMLVRGLADAPSSKERPVAVETGYQRVNGYGEPILDEGGSARRDFDVLDGEIGNALSSALLAYSADARPDEIGQPYGSGHDMLSHASAETPKPDGVSEFSDRDTRDDPYSSAYGDAIDVLTASIFADQLGHADE